MADLTRTARATGAADLDDLFAEIDAALEAYGRSIDRGLALAAEVRQFAAAIEAGHGNAVAELMEWL